MCILPSILSLSNGNTAVKITQKNKRQGYIRIPLPLYFDLCFLNNYLLAVIVTALGAKSVRSLVLTAV